MVRIILSFTNLDSQEAKTLAYEHGCEHDFVHGFHDFVAYFESMEAAAPRVAVLVSEAQHRSAVLVAVISDNL